MEYNVSSSRTQSLDQRGIQQVYLSFSFQGQQPAAQLVCTYGFNSEIKSLSAEPQLQIKNQNEEISPNDQSHSLGVDEIFNSPKLNNMNLNEMEIENELLLLRKIDQIFQHIGEVSQEEQYPAEIMKEEFEKLFRNENNSIKVTSLETSKRVLRNYKIQSNHFTKDVSETPEINFDQIEADNSQPKQHKIIKKKVQKTKKKKIKKQQAKRSKTVKCIKREVNQKNQGYKYESIKEQTQSTRKNKQQILGLKRTDKEKVERVYQKFNSRSSLGKKPQYPEMESQLATWVEMLFKTKRKLTQFKIREKAVEIMNSISQGKGHKFKGSKGWLQKFLYRHPHLYQMNVEMKSVSLQEMNQIYNKQSLNKETLNIEKAFEQYMKQEAKY